MNEIYLAAQVVEWLKAQHWEVYQEVKFKHNSAIADICAVQADRLWIIECKTSLSLQVLDQAAHWGAHWRSIAVPAPKNMRGRITAYKIARYLQVGVLEVGNLYGSSRISVEEPAPIMRENHKRAKALIAQLQEVQKDYSPAGSKGGGYWTPYKATMRQVQSYIEKHAGCTLREIMDNLQEHHYATDKSAYSNIGVCLQAYEKDWCSVEYKDRHLTFSVRNDIDRGDLKWRI